MTCFASSDSTQLITMKIINTNSAVAMPPFIRALLLLTALLSILNLRFVGWGCSSTSLTAPSGFFPRVRFRDDADGLRIVSPSASLPCGRSEKGGGLLAREQSPALRRATKEDRQAKTQAMRKS